MTEPPLGEKWDEKLEQIVQAIGADGTLTRDLVKSEHGSTRGHLDTIKLDLTTAVNSRASQVSVDAFADRMLALAAESVAAMQANTEALRALTGEIAQQRVDIGAVTAYVDEVEPNLAEVELDTEHIIDLLTDDEPPPPPPPPRSWQEQPDLIDVQFRPVLGVHTGDRSNPAAITAQMGQRIQTDPIYWKRYESPRAVCQKRLDAGTIPRLELCLPHIVTSTGRQMAGTFWKDVAAGGYDDVLRFLLSQVGALDRAIFLSAGHESDLRNEDGASPKVENPPETTWCGDWSDFPGYWARFATLARELAPKARLFLNWSGGFGGDVSKRWDLMLPPAGTFDFFGWDFFNMYGKQFGAHWDEFEERCKMFGRWDWYKRTIPDVPIIIGETATCQGPGGAMDAGQWLLNMVEFMHDNRWQGVGTGGGISQVWYFSMGYDTHPRCLDDNGVHDHAGCDLGQKWNVLPQIGADERLAWA